MGGSSGGGGGSSGAVSYPAYMEAQHETWLDAVDAAITVAVTGDNPYTLASAFDPDCVLNATNFIMSQFAATNTLSEPMGMKRRPGRKRPAFARPGKPFLPRNPSVPPIESRGMDSEPAPTPHSVSGIIAPQMPDRDPYHRRNCRVCGGHRRRQFPAYA